MRGKGNDKGLAFPVEMLFGKEIASAALVKRGMSDLEKMLTQQFRSQEAIRKEHNKVIDKTHGPIRAMLAKDKNAADGIKSMRELQARYAKTKIITPDAAKERERIFSASIAATVVPPFNYDWSWVATANSPNTATTNANRSTGQMNFNAWTNLDHGSSANVRSALGIYFRPSLENGILHLSSNPALNYGWGDWCVMDGAHTDGWIGLIVGRYNLSGGFDSWVVNQRINLWNDDSWWSGTGWRTGTNSGYPLDAWFTVDSSHWYAMWVWCGGDVSADGWGSPFWGSGAGASMSVSAPSITWELF